VTDLESKARELLRQLGLLPVDGVWKARLAKLEAALRSARAEALEEAAWIASSELIADRDDVGPGHDYQVGWARAAGTIANRIRALKETK
jgi:hypothetical protein